MKVLNAAGADEMSKKMEDQVGWVVEGDWSPIYKPDYWMGSSAWSQDHEKALRFAREQDAKQAAALMLDGVNVRVCAHIWSRWSR